MALLYSDLVPQSKECDLGPLWLNCDETAADVLDHETRQIFEDAEQSYQLDSDEAAIVFYFQTVNYRGSPTKLEAADFTLIIDIIANANGAEKRQNILDTIEERLWFRLYSYADFTDATTGELLRSFMRHLDGNRLSATTNDDSNFQGRYSIRSIRLSVTMAECVEKTACGDVPLCFDFNLIPDFGNGC